MIEEQEESSAAVVEQEDVATVASSGRPLRSDAVKNRQRLLEVAEEVFATEGVLAPVDLVAERAGLGVGTLYRHFPTKESLIEAIIRARLESIGERAAFFSTAPDACTGLFEFLHEFGYQAAAKRDLFEALGAAGIDIKANCAESFETLKVRIDRLLALAQDSGTIRRDVDAEDVIGLVAGTCQAATMPGRDSTAIDRMIDIICDGLRVA